MFVFRVLYESIGFWYISNNENGKENMKPVKRRFELELSHKVDFL